MRRVAIAGISGYIGTRLLAHLSGVENVQTIVGMDIQPPPLNSPKLKFYSRDISEPLGEVFVENQVDSAINLAFVVRPTRDTERAQQIDVGGGRNFLEACQQAGVKHILYLSSHTVYGAHPDNPIPLNEDSPLRPLHDFQYSWDKAQTEKIIHDFAASNKGVCVTILRSCPVIGPHAASAVVALMFKPPVLIGVAGYDPLLQFIHENDLVELIATFLNQRKAGVFNVAGDGTIRYSQVAKIVGKRMLKLPQRLLHLVMGLSWTLHLQNDSPTSGLEFIKYPPIISTEKLRQEIGFEFNYSSREALSSFVTADKKSRGRDI